MPPEEVSFTLNGRPCTVAVGPDVPLLYVLRNDLGLKGTRFGCGLGLCGACTVIVDGRARPSCDMPVSAVVGSDVVTLEGLAQGNALHPLQQAFIDEGAGQCGFCIAGILMTAKALLDAEPNADDGRVREALEANICRCGVHARVLRAISRVVAQGDPIQ
jgi:nicotinate dehydrogenase subunit A